MYDDMKHKVRYKYDNFSTHENFSADLDNFKLTNDYRRRSTIILLT